MMKLEKYQRLAMRTSTEGHDRVENGCLGLIGECGEIVDAVKKWLFQSGKNPPLPKKKLIDECGDVLWYCAELATGLGFSLESLYWNFRIQFLGGNDPCGSLKQMAVQLSRKAVLPYIEIYEVDLPNKLPVSTVKADIGWIMAMVNTILTTYCDSSLEDAMEKNIEKLKRRYPDGFDPERSLNRKE